MNNKICIIVLGCLGLQLAHDEYNKLELNDKNQVIFGLNSIVNSVNGRL